MKTKGINNSETYPFENSVYDLDDVVLKAGFTKFLTGEKEITTFMKVIVTNEQHPELISALYVEHFNTLAKHDYYDICSPYSMRLETMTYPGSIKRTLTWDTFRGRATGTKEEFIKTITAIEIEAINYLNYLLKSRAGEFR